MVRSASLGDWAHCENVRALFCDVQHLGPVVMIVRGTLAHLIGQHSRATTKFVFSGHCFPSWGQNNKIEGGARSFNCQWRQAFPENMIVFLAPLKAILLPRSHLALRSGLITELFSWKVSCYGRQSSNRTFLAKFVLANRNFFARTASLI